MHDAETVAVVGHFSSTCDTRYFEDEDAVRFSAHMRAWAGSLMVALEEFAEGPTGDRFLKDRSATYRRYGWEAAVVIPSASYHTGERYGGGPVDFGKALVEHFPVVFARLASEAEEHRVALAAGPDVNPDPRVRQIWVEYQALQPFMLRWSAIVEALKGGSNWCLFMAAKCGLDHLQDSLKTDADAVPAGVLRKHLDRAMIYGMLRLCHDAIVGGHAKEGLVRLENFVDRPDLEDPSKHWFECDVPDGENPHRCLEAHHDSADFIVHSVHGLYRPELERRFLCRGYGVHGLGWPVWWEDRVVNARMLQFFSREQQRRLEEQRRELAESDDDASLFPSDGEEAPGDGAGAV